MVPSSSINLTPEEQARLISIARESIRHGSVTKRPLQTDLYALTGKLCEKLASFVTLTQLGELRGCVGSIEATHPLGKCVSISAFGAAYRDHRFAPLQHTELEVTRVEISILSRPETIVASSPEELYQELRPGLDGIILEYSGHRATFLPKVWVKLPEPKQFVANLKTKAGLPTDFWSESIRYYRYQTQNFAEEATESIV